jgi:hypothetical protein
MHDSDRREAASAIDENDSNLHLPARSATPVRSGGCCSGRTGLQRSATPYQRAAGRKYVEFYFSEWLTCFMLSCFCLARLFKTVKMEFEFSREVPASGRA